MEIKIVDISELNPAAYNPRKDLQPGDDEYEKLSKSIETFGCVEPVVWNRRTGNVVGGHQRLKILAANGTQKIECSVVDLPIEQEKALNIALNKISGAWDEEKLSQVFEELQNIDFDLSLTGFDFSEINSVIDKFNFSQNDDFDVESAIDEIQTPITKIGDIWELGTHRLICGDSRNEATLEKLMNGEMADLFLTDPPYNVDYCQQVNGKKIENDNLPNSEFAQFMAESFSAADGHLKPGGAFYIWHADTMRRIIQDACNSVGWQIRQCLIWNKNNHVLGRQDYQWKHEPCLYGWKDGAAHYFADTHAERTVIDDDMPDINKMTKQQLKDLVKSFLSPSCETTVINADKPLRSDEHPTMKPVPLFGRLIRNSSRVGEIVLDLFGGSGTTIIAAEQLGRVARLVEIDPIYCDVIVKRYSALKPEETIKLNGKIYNA